MQRYYYRLILVIAVGHPGKRKEEMDDAPSPLLVLAKGLSPMPDGEVLHPFAPQHHLWDDLWLEQDQGWALREVTQKLLSVEFSEVDKAAVKEVCSVTE
jgi:hypothetical protein